MYNVLLVCDDEEDAASVEQAFHTQPGDFSVTHIRVGFGLLEYLHTHPSHQFPFLIIIDQYLPDIDSLSLLMKLKENTQFKLIPVAVMSGFASEELIREYYLAGANCFYKKPLDFPDWSHMADCLITLFHNRY